MTLDVNASSSRQARARLVGLVRCRQFTEGGRNQQRGWLFGTLTFRPWRDTTIRGVTSAWSRRSVATTMCPMTSCPVVRRGPAALRHRAATAHRASDPLFARNTNALRARIRHRRRLAPALERSAVTQGPLFNCPRRTARAFALDNSIFPGTSTARARAQKRTSAARSCAFIAQKITSDFFVEFAANRERRDERSGGTFNNGESIGSARTQPLLPGAPPARAQPRDSHAGKAYLEPTRMAPAAWMRPRAAFHGRLLISTPRANSGARGCSAAPSSRFTRRCAHRKVAGGARVGRRRTPFTTGDKLNISGCCACANTSIAVRVRTTRGNYQAVPVPGRACSAVWQLTDPATARLSGALFDNTEATISCRRRQARGPTGWWRGQASS